MSKFAFAVSGLVVILGQVGWAQVTYRASVDTSGAQSDGQNNNPSISADGRYVAFESIATNLVGGDTNGNFDAFVHDRASGTTERVSVASSGAQGNGNSGKPAISADGRFVAFLSGSSNLVSPVTNGMAQVFVRDRVSGTTELVSVDSSGAQANGHCASYGLAISANGRYVAFESAATNLVSLDTNATNDVFIHDRTSGTTERVSIDSSGAQGNNQSFSPSVSADGRYVAFLSGASNLVSLDTNGTNDVFVHDRTSGATERVSVDSSGVQGNGLSGHGFVSPSISADGRHVVFQSDASNLVAGDSNASTDIFLRDRQSGTTDRVSVGSAAAQGNGSSGFPSMSADGRYVAFHSLADTLVGGDGNGTNDAFVRDRQSATTERVSVDSAGTEGDDASVTPAISADGRCVAFTSYATDLVPNDTNTRPDVFVRERAGSGSTSLCDPGAGGVIACPCSNPPSATGRGCDNSSRTGGARLAAAGSPLLSSDSLVFTTSGQKPSTASVLVQGSAGIAGGVIYGQGVRCVGGAMQRLFTTGASGGGITAPDFSAGDPPVSVRSAALGDTILAGQSRWYLVLYRDANVLGGCPDSSFFNATQTLQVTWGQ